MKTYSEKIYFLKDYIENTFKFSVNLYATLPDDISGRTYYKEAKVDLNCANAKDAFFTLLHEAGHVLSYVKYFQKLHQPQPNIERRELYAYLYGWVINKQLNLGISKEEWRFEELQESLLGS